MKILITGNMGYVGSVLVRRLRESCPEANLTGLDLGYFGNCLSSNGIFPECRLNQQYFADVRTLPGELPPAELLTWSNPLVETTEIDATSLLGNESLVGEVDGLLKPHAVSNDAAVPGCDKHIIHEIQW
jgi:hypothetical protein